MFFLAEETFSLFFFRRFVLLTDVVNDSLSFFINDSICKKVSDTHIVRQLSDDKMMRVISAKNV